MVVFQIAGDACPNGMGCYNPSDDSYFSTAFPHYLKDPSIPIHLKEFICVIVSVKFWGHLWTGKKVQIFCDNDAVCDVITNLKPKDCRMQAHLREFLYWVCQFNFYPLVCKIGTRENDIADFISRNYRETDAISFFERENLPVPKKLIVSDSDYTFIADW